MANSSKIIRIKLDVQTDGAGKIKELGVNADDLGKAMAFATKEAKKQDLHLINWEA